MGNLSISVELEGRTAVVIGGGEAGLRAALALQAAGAGVRWLLEEIPSAAGCEIPAGIEVLPRRFAAGDLQGAVLAIICGRSESEILSIREEACRERVLLHVVDGAEDDDFIMPAQLELGSVTVSVHPGSGSIALAERIRDEIVSALGPEFASAADYLAELQNRFTDGAQQTQAFTRLLQSGLLEALRRGDPGRVERMTTSVLGDISTETDPEGEARE